MVALKGSDIERFVARPDRARPIVLVFGPDAGLVHERAEALIRASVDDPKDPFQLARLDGDDLAGEPTRLVEEANTIPLFGGRRAVWVKAGARSFAPAVEALVAAPAPDCRVVIEAGDLKRNAPLRVICERARNAAALPCYVDSEKDLVRLIDDEMRALPSHRRRAPPSFRCSAAIGSRLAMRFVSSRCSRAARRAWSSKTSWRRSLTPQRWRSTA